MDSSFNPVSMTPLELSHLATKLQLPLLDDLPQMPPDSRPSPGAVLDTALQVRDYQDLEVTDQWHTLEKIATDLKALMQRAHQSEIDLLDTQIRQIVRNLEANELRQSANWLEIDRSALSNSEQSILQRWTELSYPKLGPDSIRSAEQAAANVYLKGTISLKAKAYTIACNEHDKLLREADLFGPAVSNESVISFRAGEAASIGLDVTICRRAPHSFRKMLGEKGALAMVLMRLQTLLKNLLRSITHQ